MPVYLDDELLALSGQDLGSVLAAAQQRVSPTGRVVVDVQINGQPLVGDALNHQQSQPLGDAEIRFYSAEASVLAVTALQQARVELEEARQLLVDAAELLQQDQGGKAMPIIGQIIETWRQVQQAVLQSCQLLDLRLDDLVLDERPMAELTQQLLEQLKALRETLLAGDIVSLADVLAYEWPEVCGQWDRALELLVKRIETAHGA